MVKLRKATEEIVPVEVSLYHDDRTLFKVNEALTEIGLSQDQVLDAINSLMNKGILFRERRNG